MFKSLYLLATLISFNVFGADANSGQISIKREPGENYVIYTKNTKTGSITVSKKFLPKLAYMLTLWKNDKGIILLDTIEAENTFNDVEKEYNSFQVEQRLGGGITIRSKYLE